ncbi:MAG: 3-dehydroquinate synthase [Candidatus Omnitrophota bacterium]
MDPIMVRLGDRSYKILVGGSLSAFSGELAGMRLGSDAVIVTNPKVKALFGKAVKGMLEKAGYGAKFITVPDSEKAKSMGEAAKLLASLSASDGKGKRLFVVALGGGVVGDLAGFAASAYKRGIPYIQVPTTLLAQVDSSIGGKVAVDLPEGKNLVGAFYQPRAVFIDTSFLARLSCRDFTSGLAEVVKYAIIGDSRMFAKLEKDRAKVMARDPETLVYIVKRCASIKAGIVSRDEKEKKSLRTVLNYGHTIGHAIEAAWDYSGAYTHGEAVSLGMIAAARIANKLGMIRAGEAGRIESLIGILGLPVKLRKTKVSRIMDSLAHDKKFIHGVNRFVLPVRIGKVTVKEKVPESIIRREIERLSD